MRLKKNHRKAQQCYNNAIRNSKNDSNAYLGAGSSYIELIK